MTFEFKGKSVYYESHGEGNPVLLLNGIMMTTLSWQAFVPALQKTNRLILVDFLDQGRSARMEEAYTQELQAELVAALINHLQLRSPAVAGISYGGEVALRVAIRYPALVGRLLLFNTTAKTSAWLRDIGRGWNAVGMTLDGQAYYLSLIHI